MLLAKLDEARLADEQTREWIIRELASSPDETLEGVVGVLKTAQKHRWKIAVQVIRAIGYPRNASAIPQLIDQVSDLNSPAGKEAGETLADMGPHVVVPHLIKTMLERSQRREYWLEAVAGICSMLQSIERDFAIQCGPTVSYLLGQAVIDQELMPWSWYLLLVLEKLGPECATYALPVLIDFVKREGASEEGKEALDLIASFDKEALEPYKWVLPFPRKNGG